MRHPQRSEFVPASMLVGKAQMGRLLYVTVCAKRRVGFEGYLNRSRNCTTAVTKELGFEPRAGAVDFQNSRVVRQTASAILPLVNNMRF